MGTRNGKAAAVILIVLLLGYYQSWIFVIIYESLWKETDDREYLLPPPLPKLFNHRHVSNDVVSWKHSFRNQDPYGIARHDKTEVLSQAVQETITRLQLSGCQGKKLICGAPKACELGCQVHHLTYCLMIATSVGATLIPDFSHWPYKDKWDQWFLPLNPLNCQADSVTSSVSWFEDFVYLKGSESRKIMRNEIPVSPHLGSQILESVQEPLLWYLAQVASFTVQLQPETKFARPETDLAHPKAGILLRRRDQLGEKKQPVESLDSYFRKVKRYFDNLPPELNDDAERRVYVATDDVSTLKFLAKRYRAPRWNIAGGGVNRKDKEDVRDLLQDLIQLVDCDLVLCSFTSDLCRLVLELKISRDVSERRSVQSLSTKYSFNGKEIKKLHFVVL